MSYFEATSGVVRFRYLARNTFVSLPRDEFFDDYSI